MSSAVRVVALLAASLLAASLLTGCGEDEKDPRPEPTPTTSDTPSSSSTPVGPLVDAPMFSFHLPELWSEGEPLSSSNVTTVSGGPADGFDFTDLAVETWTLKHFDDVAKLSGDVLANFQVYAPKGRLVGVTDWAGQPAYHLAGSGSLAGHAEQFGVHLEGPAHRHPVRLRQPGDRHRHPAHGVRAHQGRATGPDGLGGSLLAVEMTGRGPVSR